jgi:2-dehydropantoate 2-reductase
MNMLIVGAGATGGYFGGRLVAAGRDVTFLVREGRAAQLARDGLVIKSPHGDLQTRPKFTTAQDLKGPFDVVLVTVKAFGLEGAMHDFAKAVGPETTIVPILNGMKHVDQLVQRFGAARVAGGVCRVATTLDGDGRIVQLADFQDMLYGELDGSESARMQALHEFMSGAGFKAALSRDIVQDLWNKWTMLAGMGAACCLMRGSVGEIEAAPGGVALVNALIEEIAAIATANGHPPASPVIAAVRGMLTAKGSPMASSMYRDLEQGKTIEADHIIGDLLARAEAKGVATPLLAATYANLSVYQNRLARQRA